MQQTSIEREEAKKIAIEQYAILYPAAAGAGKIDENWIIGWIDCYMSGINKTEIESAEKWRKMRATWDDLVKGGKIFNDEFFETIKGEQDVKNARLVKVGQYLANNNFDRIMLRVYNEHNELYRTNCYNKGYEPHPNNKTQLLLDYITDHGEDVTGQVDDNPFESVCYEFENYYFQLNSGQGCYWRIFDQNKETLLTL